MARSILRSAILLFLVCAAAPGVAATFTSSQSGNWSVATTWGGAGVPGSGDTATINSGHTVTLDIPVAVANLTLTGNVTGSQSLSVATTFTWNGGTQSGSGTTTIPNSATMNVTNVGFLDGRTLNNPGT